MFSFIAIFSFFKSWSLDGWFGRRLRSLDGHKGRCSGRHLTICALTPVSGAWGGERMGVEEWLLTIVKQKRFAASGIQPCCVTHS